MSNQFFNQSDIFVKNVKPTEKANNVKSSD